jgi:hypothetical protein
LQAHIIITIKHGSLTICEICEINFLTDTGKGNVTVQNQQTHNTWSHRITKQKWECSVCNWDNGKRINSLLFKVVFSTFWGSLKLITSVPWSYPKKDLSQSMKQVQGGSSAVIYIEKSYCQ